MNANNNELQQLEEELRRILPSTLKSKAGILARLLIDIEDQSLTEQEISGRLLDSPLLIELVEALSGNKVHLKKSLREVVEAEYPKVC